MTDTQQLLRRAGEGFGERKHVMDSLIRLRARRERNRRIGGAALGIAVALAIAGSLLRTLQTVDRPAGQPTGIFARVHGWIVYGGEGGIWAMEPRPGEFFEQIRLSDVHGLPLSWSRDGTKLLIQRGQRVPGEDRTELVILNADGTETPVIAGRNILGGSLSPDGSTVVYADSDRVPRSSIFAVDADGGTPWLLRAGRGSRHILGSPTFSSNGQQVAYLDGSGDSGNKLWVMNVDGSGARPLLRSDLEIWGRPAWSPDGSRLAFAAGSADEPGIWVVGADGQGLTEVIDRGADPYWSPDGSRIALTKPPGTVAIAAVDGTHVHEIGYGTSGPWNPLPLDEVASTIASTPVPTGPVAFFLVLVAVVSVVVLVPDASRGMQHLSSACSKRSSIALVLAAIIVATGACSPASEPAPDPHPDLEGALETLPAAGSVGLLRTGDSIWREASGDTTAGQPARPADRFAVASITKTFVATVVLQLVDEDLLSLDDSIEDVLPGALPYGRRITIRQLLNHSSGLGDQHMAEFSPRKTLEALAEARPLSQPGAVHNYANVNYIVVGIIVEEVTGRPLEQVVRSRIFAPLGLEHTSFGKGITESSESAPWLGYPEVPSRGLVAAGGIVSTVDDVATFYRSLFAGELLGRELLTEMTRTIEIDGQDRAGLGIFELALSCDSAWGHAGESPGYSSMALASGDGSKVVVVAQNSGGWMAAQAAAEQVYCS